MREKRTQICRYRRRIFMPSLSVTGYSSLRCKRRISKMPDEVAGHGELALLCRRTANSVDGRRIVCGNIIRVLVAQLGAEGDSTAKPEVQPRQVLAVPGLAPGALAFQVVDKLVANVQRTVVVVELVLNVIDDGVVGGEAMGCQGIALGPIRSRQQGRTGDCAGVRPNIRVRAIADAGSQSVT